VPAMMTSIPNFLDSPANSRRKHELGNSAAPGDAVSKYVHGWVHQHELRCLVTRMANDCANAGDELLEVQHPALMHSR
jgi:hypothetical protein